MNAALRAVVRSGLNRGMEVYAIYEGYAGMVEGGERFRPMAWTDVGGILHLGGTIIGYQRIRTFYSSLRNGEAKRREASPWKLRALVILEAKQQINTGTWAYPERGAPSAGSSERHKAHRRRPA